MKKLKILIFLISSFFLWAFISPSNVLAQYLDCVAPYVCRSEENCPGTIDKSWQCGENKYCCRLSEPAEQTDITNPALLKFGQGEGADIIAQIIANVLKITFAISGLILLAMLLTGAISWMTGGGDKEALANAQKRITSALVGFVIFMSVFAIINFIAPALGLEFLHILEIEWPTP